MEAILFKSWQVLIYAIRSITLISYVFCVYLIYLLVTKNEEVWGFPFALFAFWMIVEAIYFPYYKATHARLCRTKQPLTHACTNQSERKELVRKCFTATQLANHAKSEKQKQKIALDIISRWFGGALISSIKRRNLEEWVAWAFFDIEFPNASEFEMNQVAEIADHLENIIGYHFPEGYNDKVKCMRLNIDPVYSTQRPLVYYAAISILHFLGFISLTALGFKSKYIKDQKVYYRPQKKTIGVANDNISGDDQKKPIVFVHGIGIGYLHYFGIIAGISNKVPIYLINWPTITMSLGHENHTSIEEFKEMIKTLLNKFGHRDACFVGHSFGTIAISWLLHDHRNTRHLVSSTVLIDPITFLLCDPAVCYNFIHRVPRVCAEIMMHYFVSRELYISHTLSRQFSWSNAVIFASDLPIINVNNDPQLQINKNIVILSGADAIVPSHDVNNYLQGYNNEVLGKENKRLHTEVIIFPNTHHGQLMLSTKDCNILVSKIHKSAGVI